MGELSSYKYSPMTVTLNKKEVVNRAYAFMKD